MYTETFNYDSITAVLKQLPAVSREHLLPETSYSYKLFRTLPSKSFRTLPDERVTVLGQDSEGFMVVFALVAEHESCCWRCSKISVNDPKLEVCPHCGGDFND